MRGWSILGLLVLLVGCEQTIDDESTIQERNGLAYLPSQETPFTGKVLTDYPNGRRKVEGRYEDGKKEGVWTTWYVNGQKWTEMTYKDGKGNGPNRQWCHNGQKLVETTYRDDKIDGSYLAWFCDGQKEIERSYEDGEPVGVWTRWYETGQKFSETTFKDGKMDLVREWQQSGRLKFDGPAPPHWDP